MTSSASSPWSRVRALLPATAAALLFAASPLGPLACGGGDGTVDGAVTVEAQQRNVWVLYSFADDAVLTHDDGSAMTVDDPSTVQGWDLAFSQFVIATNSGTSASSDSVSRGALLATEGDVDDWPSLAEFDARCSEFVAADATENAGNLGCNAGTPTVDDGYIDDFLDDPDGAGPFTEVSYNSSLTFWFEYTFVGHEVTPYGNIYVVETHDGQCVKLQITDYYDETGETGFTSFSWDYLLD